MSKIEKKDPALYFAALKLIEQLNHDGHISASVFRKIISEYADLVDTSKFIVKDVEDRKGEEKYIHKN